MSAFSRDDTPISNKEIKGRLNNSIETMKDTLLFAVSGDMEQDKEMHCILSKQKEIK